MLLGPEAFVLSAADRIFLVAIAVAFLVAVAASIARYYLIAIMAVLAGCGAIIVDRYGDFQQLPAGSENIPAAPGSPVKWSRLYIDSAAASRSGNLANISTLSIMGTNVSDKAIKFAEVYFLCDLDGTKLNVQVGRGGARYRIRDMGPLPPAAFFFVVSDPLGPTNEGLSPSEFLKTWSTISFVAKYNGTSQKIEFDRQTVESALPMPNLH